MRERGERNVFHDYYRALVQALFEQGVTSNVFCVNVDAVIAAWLLKLLWQPYRAGELDAEALETAAFTIFLFARMAGSAAEIEDHLNRGRNMDTRSAYSPGVAAACELIVADPLNAAEVTTRANLVAVVTNGTAVLGLGAIGALAAKPVMEGKAVLFKKFAGIDAFDIEVDERDPDKLVEIVAALEPTFGAINLEDIKAPECFEVERKLRERMKIPVFHDDQHGTAIIVAAAISTACTWSASGSRRCGWSPAAPGRRRSPASISW